MTQQGWRWAWAAIPLWFAASVTLAQERFIEDVQVSRSNGEAMVRIRLACPMRFMADVATQQGLLLEIRVAPFDACRQLGLGNGIASELMRPVSGRLALLEEIEYESLGLGDNLLMLRFERPVEVRVQQGSDLRSVEVIVQLAEGPAIAVTPVPDAAEEPAGIVAAPPTPAAIPARPGAGREPLNLTVREPVVRGDFVLNLMSRKQPITPADLQGLEVPEGYSVYISEAAIDGTIWYRLRLGFFASEAEADAQRTALGAGFPSAWVGRAEPREMAFAATNALDAAAVGESLPVVALAERAVSPQTDGSGPLSEVRMAEMLREGREALLAARYDAAAATYLRLLEEPGAHRPEAREYLGLAYEKSGQLAQAETAYRAYLAEFPEGQNARRVEQRLYGVVLRASTAAERAPAERVVTQTLDGRGRWDFASGIAQYYRRNVIQLDQDQEDILGLSAVFTDVDFTVRHSGGTIDFLGRAAMSHVYDVFLEDDDRGISDSSRISYAYVDVGAANGRWGVRSGRDTLHDWGVLGRYDGMHFWLDPGNARRWHVIAGYPVESSRVGIRTDRQFVSLGVDFQELWTGWNVSASLTQQVIDGISDRQAVGTQLRYVSDRHSLVTVFDYDLGFSALNTALALGTWRLPNRMTLSASVDMRKAPILTARNALIGQPVATIDELLLVWSESEIRALAEDRTAESRSATLGLAAPLGERFQVNADVTMAEIDGTVESGGVSAIAGTGAQMYYSTSVIGSGLLGQGDVNILSLRYAESDLFTVQSVLWDGRFPWGNQFRINPRLRYSIREGLTDGSTRTVLSPAVRLLLRLRNHYRIEFEMGYEQGDREFATGTQESSGYFLNLGYRADY
jgi:tetratricopeptide (TPR) repeat protein